MKYCLNLNYVIPHEALAEDAGTNNKVSYLGLGPASATLRVLCGMTEI